MEDSECMGTGAGARLQAGVAMEIRLEMTRQGLRQSDLARRLGELDKWVSLRLRGIIPMTLDDLDRIAKALGVDPAGLWPESSRSMSVIQPYPEQPEPTPDDRPVGRSGSGDTGQGARGRRVRRIRIYTEVPHALPVAA